MITTTIIVLSALAVFGLFFLLAKAANKSNITRLERELDRMERHADN